MKSEMCLMRLKVPGIFHVVDTIFEYTLVFHRASFFLFPHSSFSLIGPSFLQTISFECLTNTLFFSLSNRWKFQNSFDFQSGFQVGLTKFSILLMNGHGSGEKEVVGVEQWDQVSEWCLAVRTVPRQRSR